MSIEVMNAVWQHSKASGRQKLVLLAIADHQGEIGAWPSIATLARMVNASERSVQRDIAELAEMGELRIEERQAPSRGQYKTNLYWVTVDGAPEVTDLNVEVTESTSEVTNQGVRGDTVGVLNITRTITRNVKEAYPLLDAEGEFKKFYEVYPRKREPLAAKRAYLKALQIVDADTILAGAVRLANDPNLPEKQFIPYPATWLNAGGWDDEPYPARVISFAEKKAREEQAYLERQARIREVQEREAAERREQERLAREEIEKNPPKRCEAHDRILVMCMACKSAGLN